jgi:hypothetical protein
LKDGLTGAKLFDVEKLITEDDSLMKSRGGPNVRRSDPENRGEASKMQG